MPFNLVRYSQQDPQWRNQKIGGGPDTIGYIGCALTCVAMYSSGWGYTETPATLNAELTPAGGFIDEAIVWSAITRFHSEIRSTGLTLCTNSDAPLAQINASLAAGQPVIVEVDFSASPGLQTHWVLIYGQQGDDYLIQDPWPYPPETQPVTLLSRFSQGKPLQRAIKAVAWYQASAGTSEPPAPAPLPAPVTTDLVLQVIPTATAGIKLHTAASADSLANYAEMPGMALSVIEDKAGALAKIGQNNQWIYVCDPNNHQGYVAAWYVLVASGGAPAPAPAPGPAPTPPPPPTPAPSTPPAPTPPVGIPERFQVVVLSSVGSAGLSVRDQPSPGGTRVNVEKAGARLTVLEPQDTALPKIGKPGQWLAVKATNNQRGYVMAQYVQLKQ